MRVHTPFSKVYILFLTTRPITVSDTPKGCSIIGSNVNTNSIFATRKWKSCKGFSSWDKNMLYNHYLFFLTSINKAGMHRLLVDKFCSNGQQGVCVIFFTWTPTMGQTWSWKCLFLTKLWYGRCLCQKILIHSDLITLKEIHSPGFQTVAITYQYFQHSKFVTL